MAIVPVLFSNVGWVASIFWKEFAWISTKKLQNILRKAIGVISYELSNWKSIKILYRVS